MPCMHGFGRIDCDERGLGRRSYRTHRKDIPTEKWREGMCRNPSKETSMATSKAEFESSKKDIHALCQRGNGWRLARSC